MCNPAPFFSKFTLFHNNSLIIYSDAFLCNRLQTISFSKLTKNKTLIIGESNTGKTELTSFFLSYLRKRSDICLIIVLDMGPERFQVKGRSIGGKIVDYSCEYRKDPKIQEFSYNVTPPRSSAKTQEEIYRYCLKNYIEIVDDFNNSLNSLLHSNKNSALIINDFSIFLHLGSPLPIIRLLKTPHTIFINSYFGSKLAQDYNSNISWRERLLVKSLFPHFDYCIHLI